MCASPAFSSGSQFPETSRSQTDASALPDIDSGTAQAALLALLAGTPRTRAGALRSDGPEVGDKIVLLGNAPESVEGSRFLKWRDPRNASGPSRGPANVPAWRRPAAVLESAGVLWGVLALDEAGILERVAGLLVDTGIGAGARLDLSAFGSTRFDVLLFGQTTDAALAVVSHRRIGTVLSEAHTGGVSATVIAEINADPALLLLARGIAVKWDKAALQQARTPAAGAVRRDAGDPGTQA